MRNRYRENGLRGFADHEVLELLLYHAYPRCDTNAIAHRFLAEFGSIHNLLDTDVPVLMHRLQCSENVAMLLSLLPKVMGRSDMRKHDKGSRIRLHNEQVAGDYVKALLKGNNVEVFYVLCLDKSKRLINAAQISRGTVDVAAVYPREVVKAALDNGSTSVILAHNHPAGTLQPSRGDIQVTTETTEMLNGVGIAVLDHIIATGDTFYSFAACENNDLHVRGYY
jgi:DNA repair protein RadC